MSGADADDEGWRDTGTTERQIWEEKGVAA
jgi:hypothetical protein